MATRLRLDFQRRQARLKKRQHRNNYAVAREIDCNSVSQK
jgi:hypothetical protein